MDKEGINGIISDATAFLIIQKLVHQVPWSTS